VYVSSTVYWLVFLFGDSILVLSLPSLFTGLFLKGCRYEGLCMYSGGGDQCSGWNCGGIRNLF
jgi:hypothetical protein